MLNSLCLDRGLDNLSLKCSIFRQSFIGYCLISHSVFPTLSFPVTLCTSDGKLPNSDVFVQLLGVHASDFFVDVSCFY